VAASRRAGAPVPALPPPASLLRPLEPLLTDAEVVLLNVEAAIGEGPAARKCRPGSTACYAFRQPIAAADALRQVAPRSAVVGTVANNHSGDAGAEGFVRTQRHLREAGVHVTGADTLATPVPVDGDTVAVLGFATSPRGPHVRDLAAVRRHVRRAAERWGRVVVTMHMGAEGVAAQRTPDRTETFYGENRGNPVAFARAAVESGASLVVGHGPHVLRALEWHDDALVAYSLGNLVTHGPFSMGEPLNRGAVLCATLAADGAVRDAIVHPTRQRRAGAVLPDPSARPLVLLDSLSRLDFPRTGARVDLAGRVLTPEGRTRILVP
jgi:poly-gamma-glutamate capsule biosynthesis protein CapA/YwtB (metallophosphatase superfamily)